MSLKEKKIKILFSVLIVLTLVLLWLGVTEPMVTISLNSDVDAGIAKFNNDIINTTRSIWGTVKELYLKERTLVAFLIFLFSVIIPIAKSLIFSFILYSKFNQKKLKKILSLISKWSMADVFVVAIFLAFLATDGQMEIRQEKIKIIGMTFNIKITALMQTTLQPGFYYFLIYCLFSMIVFQSWNYIAKKSIS